MPRVSDHEAVRSAFVTPPRWNALQPGRNSEEACHAHVNAAATPVVDND